MKGGCSEGARAQSAHHGDTRRRRRREQIYAKSTPAENMAAMGWYAGFVGPDPDFGRLIGKVESWGSGCARC
jgi:hypothetical protein